MTANRTSPRTGAERARGKTLRRGRCRVLAQTERDLVRVCPCGDIDIGSVDEIREQIAASTASGAQHVVLDLRGATFLDTAGLHLVLDVDAASRVGGWEFGLIGGPTHVQRVFDLTGSRARLPFLSAAELAALLAAPGDRRPTAHVGRGISL